MFVLFLNVCWIKRVLGTIDGCSKLINHFESRGLVIDDCYNRVSASEFKHRLVTLVQLAMDDKKGYTFKVA
jgi:hypothetical protein